MRNQFMNSELPSGRLATSAAAHQGHNRARRATLRTGRWLWVLGLLESCAGQNSVEHAQGAGETTLPASAQSPAPAGTSGAASAQPPEQDAAAEGQAGAPIADPPVVRSQAGNDSAGSGSAGVAGAAVGGGGAAGGGDVGSAGPVPTDAGSSAAAGHAAAAIGGSAAVAPNTAWLGGGMPVPCATDADCRKALYTPVCNPSTWLCDVCPVEEDKVALVLRVDACIILASPRCLADEDCRFSGCITTCDAR